MGDLVRDATGNDLTYRIIGAAMAVHNAPGPGYKEEVYEKATLAPVALPLNFGHRYLECPQVLPGSAAEATPVRRLGRDNVERRG